MFAFIKLLKLLDPLGSWLDRFMKLSERNVQLHAEASAAIRRAVTETRIVLAACGRAALTVKKTESAARAWTEASNKIKAEAFARKDRKLHKLADECMDFSGKLADPQLKKAILKTKVEKLFIRTKRKGLYARRYAMARSRAQRARMDRRN